MLAYLLLLVSIALNGTLVWYIRKLLNKYWFDVDARQKFTEMLGQYEESLNSIYKLEELYGEEIIKKAIIQTQFVIEACKEFREAIDSQASSNKEENTSEEEDTEEDNNNEDKNVIVLREGEKVSQSAGSYKKIILQP